MRSAHMSVCSTPSRSSPLTCGPHRRISTGVPATVSHCTSIRNRSLHAARIIPLVGNWYFRTARLYCVPSRSTGPSAARARVASTRHGPEWTCLLRSSCKKQDVHSGVVPPRQCSVAGPSALSEPIAQSHELHQRRTPRCCDRARASLQKWL